jgi:hypothetical protein
MRRLGSSRIAVGVVVLGVLVAAVVAVASAQAAPSKKNYTVQVAVTNDAVSHQDFTVTLANDTSSNTTLGSANVTPPTGFTVDTASTAQSGWSATVVSNVVQLRSATSGAALAPGSSMKVSVHVASPALPITPDSPTPCAGTADWSSQVKQSNDFNGTNNSFTILAAKSDQTPLGSFEIADIGTPIAVAPFFTPSILLQQYTSTTTAYDTCHNVKGNYSGATLTHHGLTGATYSPSGGQTLSWLNGTGTVKFTPVVSETNNTLTVTDPTTAITDTSKPFDTQQKICTFADPDACAWQNGNGSIKASAPKPLTGSLGVGFDPVANVAFVCGGSGGALGDTVITIAPHDTPTDDYQVTIVYSKQVSGTGNANSFIFCISTDNGLTFTQLQACSTFSTTPLPDCIVDQKRVTGGALQVILNLQPGDPYVGGK